MFLLPTVSKICQDSGFDSGDIRTFVSGEQTLEQITCVNFVGQCSGEIRDGEAKECTVQDYAVKINDMPTGINVALYFNPPWDLLIELKNQYPNLPVNGVINPANGPGEAIDNEIAAEVLKLQAAGITVLGYTFTNNCQRPITDGISEDIDKYREWYNVDGIFYDELNCQEADLEYVETLDDLANSRGALFTIGNPGTGIPESFIGILDNYIIYEDRGLPALSLIEERTFGLDKRNFSITAFGVPETEINSDYILALSELVQYIYITDDDLPNPYDTFSSYIDELFAILSQQADE